MAGPLSHSCFLEHSCLLFAIGKFWFERKVWPLRAVSVPAYLVIGRAHLPEPCAHGPSQTPSAQGLQGTLGLHDTHVVGLSSVHAHALPPHQTSLTKYKFKCQTPHMSTQINVKEFQGVDRIALSHRSSSECGSLSLRTGCTLTKEACASDTPVSGALWSCILDSLD